MSHSYREPYGCAYPGAHEVKKSISRLIRHKQNQYVRTNWESDNILVPNSLDCCSSDPYDEYGHKKRLHTPTARDWDKYCKCLNNIGDIWQLRWYRKNYKVWPPKWFVKYTRK